MKIKALVSSLAFAAATLGLSATATAEQNNSRLFDKLDVNGDGVISQDEAATLEQRFDQLDEDNSGDLDRQELQNFQGGQQQGQGNQGGNQQQSDEQRKQEAFNKLDSNGDGRVSKDEAAANPSLEGEFEDLDQDNSGDLDQQEFQEYDIGGGLF